MGNLTKEENRRKNIARTPVDLPQGFSQYSFWFLYKNRNVFLVCSEIWEYNKLMFSTHFENQL